MLAFFWLKPLTVGFVVGVWLFLFVGIPLLVRAALGLRRLVREWRA